MKLSKITSNIISPRTTGYTAAVGIGLTILSGYSKNKSLQKFHKPFAIITAISTLAHIGLIEWYSYKYKRNK